MRLSSGCLRRWSYCTIATVSAVCADVVVGVRSFCSKLGNAISGKKKG